MIHSINMFVALIGTGLAGIIDLLTTEIPDEIPFLLSAWGLFSWFIYSLFVSDFSPFFLSAISGVMLLSFGWLLYLRGMWGGGDALLLGSVGFLLPSHPQLPVFPIAFTFSLFFIGGIYSLAYSIFLSARHPEVFGDLLSRIIRNKHYISSILLLSLLFMPAIGWKPALVISLAGISAVIAWHFGKSIEETVFIREISAKEVKEGDVLADSGRIDGLTAEEAEKIRKKGGKVKIKEGVRFGPAFPLSLLFLMLMGV